MRRHWGRCRLVGLVAVAVAVACLPSAPAASAGAYDLSGLSGDATWRTLVLGLDTYPRISTSPISATQVRLGWTWSVAGGDWTYATTAAVAGRRVAWSPAAMVPGLGAADRLVITHPQAPARVTYADGSATGSSDLGGVLSAVRAAYATQLAGSPGTRIAIVRPDGHVTYPVRFGPTPGTPVTLTIRPGTQAAAEGALTAATTPSVLVALRPSTGELLAVASTAGAGRLAMTTPVAPGSTFKTVTSLALLRAGAVALGSTVSCAPSFTVGGVTFGNDSWYPSSELGTIAYRTAFANSCNTAVVSQHAAISGAQLSDAARSLGLLQSYDLGILSYAAAMPLPDDEGMKAQDMIGMGQVTASPLAMAVVMASAVRGAAVMPQLLAGRATPVADAAPIASSDAADLALLLREAVVAGTASGLATVPGDPVRAKTGTADFFRGGQTLEHTWLIAAQGDLAVCVFNDVGVTGARTALPIARRFLVSLGGG